MFNIQYRIVDDLEGLRYLSADEFNREFADIMGFFSINYNGTIEGYYHSEPLRDDEIGNEMLTLWFEMFISVANTLPVSNYVAFREIDSFNTWQKFVKYNDEIIVSIVKDNLSNSDYFITEPSERFSATSIEGIIIPYYEFSEEIIKKAELFIHEIGKLNKELVKTSLFKRLEGKLQNLKQGRG